MSKSCVPKRYFICVFTDPNYYHPFNNDDYHHLDDYHHPAPNNFVEFKPSSEYFHDHSSAYFEDFVGGVYQLDLSFHDHPGSHNFLHPNDFHLQLLDHHVASCFIYELDHGTFHHLDFDS